MKIINLTNNTVTLYSDKIPTFVTLCKNRRITAIKFENTVDKFKLKTFPVCKEISHPEVIENTLEKDFIKIGNTFLPITQTEKSIINLPNYYDDTLYIVSHRTLRTIRELYPHRDDFIVPNKLISRINSNGTFSTIGCLEFSC